MAALAAEAPSGTVTSVFNEDADVQGTYDFLESPHVDPAAMEAGLGAAVARRCATEAHVFVAVDGSSLTFVDRTGEKRLGSVGTYAAGAKGLKVITALALDAEGVPLGPVHQSFWQRPSSRPTRRRPASKRPVDKKETGRWISAVDTAAARLRDGDKTTKAVFLVDREADSAAMLCALAETGQGFVVRATWNRDVEAGDKGRVRKLNEVFTYTRPLGRYDLEVAARPGRKARTANIELTATNVVLTLKDPRSKKVVRLALSAVRAMEVGTCPPDEDRIEWALLSTLPAKTFKDAMGVVGAYTLRWRIEEFHRTWKSGKCNVEESQLRSAEALEKWALVLAAVACRIERLKLRSRREPDAPATTEFTELEIRAVVLLKQRHGRPAPTPKNGGFTLAQMTTLVAQLGGYTGKSSGGPPGTTTLSRGLLKVRAVAEALAVLREGGEIG
jgi:hypothetical protein